MIRHVQVERLPGGISFPRDLQPKIHFDAQRKRLCFDGFMSKATFDRLYRLAEDRHYRRAIEELFQICTYEDADGSVSSPAKRCACIAAVVGSLIAIAAALVVMFWR